MVRYLELSSAEQFSNKVEDRTVDRMKKKANSTLLSKFSPSSETKHLNDFHYANINHAIPDKSVADCVESLIGAYLEVMKYPLTLLKTLSPWFIIFFCSLQDFINQDFIFSDIWPQSSHAIPRMDEGITLWFKISSADSTQWKICVWEELFCR